MINSYLLHTSKLQGEYKETFQKIEMYVNTNLLDDHSKEELMSNLLDTFLSAQEDQRPVEKITGKNIEKFCKTFCSGYGFREHILYFVESIGGLVIIMFLISAFEAIGALLSDWEGERIDFFTRQSSFNIFAYGVGLLLGYLIECVANFIVKRIMFKRKKVTMPVVFSVRIIIAIVAILALFLFFSDTRAVDTPLWITFSVSALLTVIYLLITRKRRKEKKANKISIWELAESTQHESSLAQFEKKLYFKRNAKREKKGLVPLTQEEFLAVEEVECCKWDKKPAFYIALPFVATLLATLLVGVSSGFAAPADVWFFVLLIFVIESLMMYGLWRIVKQGTIERLDWIEKERENPMSGKRSQIPKKCNTNLIAFTHFVHPFLCYLCYNDFIVDEQKDSSAPVAAGKGGTT